MSAFEDLCRYLFDAADERFLILKEELLVDAYSLDRRYALTCSMADETEGPWEGTVEISVGSDAANSAASMFEDVYDEAGHHLEVAWEVTVRWLPPSVTDPAVVIMARGEVAKATGLRSEDLATQSSAEWSGMSWTYHPALTYSVWLADDEDPEEDAARIMAMAEDGLARIQELARFWPLAEQAEEELPE